MKNTPKKIVRLKNEALPIETRQSQSFWVMLRPYLKEIALFLCWRIGLYVLGMSADVIIKYAPSFPYANTILFETYLPRHLYSWASFDGVHYLTIARKGYLQTVNIQAFFPVYPLLMKATAIFAFGAYNNRVLLLSGFMVSNLLACSSVLLFFEYVKRRFSRDLAWRSTVLFLLFPTSFFFGSLYSESLFLTVVLAAFLFGRSRYWLISGAMIAIASATRVVGIFLIPALSVEAFFQHFGITRKSNAFEVIRLAVQLAIRKWYNVIALGIGGLGLFAYMYFLWINFHDPLYFFHIQSEFGGVREETIILFPQVVFRYMKILLTVRPIDWKYFAYVQEILITLLVAGVLTWATIKRRYKIKVSELVFSWSAFLLPTVTGTFSSMPRYVLACFPIFFLVPQLVKNKYAYLGILLVSGFLLCLNTVLFVQGYWVG